MADRILLCATDAGGGRNLSAIAAYLADQRPEIHVDLLVGPITEDMFQDSPTAPQMAGIETLEDARHTLERLRPDVAILGRTRYISPERRLTIAARELAIPTVQIVDDWMNYRLNVVDENDQLSHMTDLLCCPDEMAVADARAEGLPPERLIATGSPALAKLCDKLRAMARDLPPVPQVIGNANARPVILFLSETFLADHGNGSAPRQHGPYLGYTEQTVRADLAEAVNTLGVPTLIVEKLHPSEADMPIPPATANGIDWISLGGSDLLELIVHADLVVGMRSIALLESVLAGRPTASYQPGLLTTDSCTAARLGLAPALRNHQDLIDWLRHAHNNDTVVPERPAFADPKSAARVVDNALSLIHRDVLTPKHQETAES